MDIKFFAFFFSDNQYFRMFLVSMADIIGSYDAVRAVAVAKRREYGMTNYKQQCDSSGCV
jgi:hypothetical protein